MHLDLFNAVSVPKTSKWADLVIATPTSQVSREGLIFDSLSLLNEMPSVMSDMGYRRMYSAWETGLRVGRDFVALSVEVA